MNEKGYPYYYSKAAVAGFVLTLSSLVLVSFFVFNDSMLFMLGRDLFDMLIIPIAIGIFLTNRLGIVYSIIGLVNSIRFRLKGKAFSIIGIVIFLIATVIMVMMVGLLLIVAIGGEARPPDVM